MSNPPEANLFLLSGSPYRGTARMSGWPFSICRYMRKMEICFMGLIAERVRIDILHDRVTSLLERIVDNFARKLTTEDRHDA